MTGYRKLSDDEFAALERAAAEWEKKNPGSTYPYCKAGTQDDLNQMDDEYFETFMPRYPEYV